MGQLFFMDESGHDGKNTPHVVVGGYSLDEDDYPAFQTMIIAHFIDCFGVNLDDFVELKGASLLAAKKFRWAKSREKMNDEDRHLHIRRFLSKDSLNSPPNGDDHAAYGQACHMFVERIFDIMTRYNCKAVAALTIMSDYKLTYKEFYPSNDSMDNFTTHLLNDLEFALYKNIGNSKIIADRSETKSDELRRQFFHKVTGSDNIEFVDSHKNLGVQIADILLYCINWGVNIGESNRPELNEFYEKYIYRNIRPKILYLGVKK